MSDFSDGGLLLPFWMPDAAYTYRDQDMFVAGFEFCTIYERAKLGEPFESQVRSENVSRVKMMMAKLGRPYTLTRSEYRMCGDEGHPEEYWWFLAVS